MTPESHLQRLREALSPDVERRDRVRANIRARIAESKVFERAKQEAMPDDAVRGRVWSDVLHRTENPVLSGVLDRLRHFFDPAEAQRILLRDRLLMRLTPVPAHSSYAWTKRVAAFTLVVVALKASPALFLAPRTVAESVVMAVPTKGTVEIALHDLWQPIDTDITLNDPVQLRTSEGEATVLLHDDGTIRLAPHASIALHDLSDRPEPAKDVKTLSLSSGRIWAQGLLPSHLRGIVIATPYGEVTVHGGSVSLLADETALTVRVWDRHAIVTQGDVRRTLVAGERIRLGAGAIGEAQKIDAAEYDEEWVVQNLKRDAVHRREIAQMQQERRAAQAGILPGSPLYPVKRVAERVDVLLTLDAESKIQKKLEVASTRLNEAAALIAEGSSGADLSLQEYKETLLAVAVGSGDTLTHNLVRLEAAENAAELSAVLPDEDGYLLKKTVLETSAELPSPDVDESDVQGTILTDSVDVLQNAVAQGDAALAEEAYLAIQPHLTALESGGLLTADVKKEVLTQLSDAAQRLQASATGSVTTLEESLRAYLPEKPQEPTVAPLTEEEIAALVGKIRERIFVYSQPRARWNQLQYEIKQLSDHPDAGSILRRLYHALPENGLADYVRTGIRELRKDAE